MTKEELITKQQLEIEEYKIKMKQNKIIIRHLKGKLTSIGAPLNDNCLKFNNEQLKWCFAIEELINNINT